MRKFYLYRMKTVSYTHLDVQVMVEGPGHMPLDQIEANMKLQQSICMGVCPNDTQR